MLNFSSTNESLFSKTECPFSGASSYVYITIAIGYIITLFPLFSFVLYYGVQTWLQSRTSSSAPPMSHLDSFTCHMAIMELGAIFWCFLTVISVFTLNNRTIKVGLKVFSFSWYGQGFFHILTCVERYLAAVHPVAYFSLRNERGIRIRNISIGCTWLLSFSAVGLTLVDITFLVFDCIFLISVFAVVSFCCLSVLYVLIRPGPGEQGRDRAKVDKSKQRAFYTIVAILGVLVVKFSWASFWLIAAIYGGNVDCWMIISEFLMNLPSGLLLPLLFLHRKGKLEFCKTSIQ